MNHLTQLIYSIFGNSSQTENTPELKAKIEHWDVQHAGEVESDLTPKASAHPDFNFNQMPVDVTQRILEIVGSSDSLVWLKIALLSKRWCGIIRIIKSINFSHFNIMALEHFLQFNFNLFVAAYRTPQYIQSVKTFLKKNDLKRDDFLLCLQQQTTVLFKCMLKDFTSLRKMNPDLVIVNADKLLRKIVETHNNSIKPKNEKGIPNHFLYRLENEADQLFDNHFAQNIRPGYQLFIGRVLHYLEVINLRIYNRFHPILGGLTFQKTSNSEIDSIKKILQTPNQVFAAKEMDIPAWLFAECTPISNTLND